MEPPSVTFVIPIRNASSLLDPCLKSIRAQNYPSSKLEIIIADGNSTDNSLEICKRYDCRILNNPRIRAEYGLELGLHEARGEICVVFAADNELPSPEWLNRIVYPFTSDPAIDGVYTHMEPAPKDNALNRYYCKLHVEPFTWFVFGRAVQPKDYHEIYQVRDKNEKYVVFDFPLSRYPLIAWAQGFALRKAFMSQIPGMGDDILPLITMIQEGRKLAYVPDDGVYHHHLTTFSGYMRKYRGRIRNNLYESDVGFRSRAAYLSPSRQLLQYLWILYGCTLVGPIFHAVLWFLKDRDPCWFWHIPASVGLSYLIVFEAIRKIFNPTTK
jgi:glycosyltransferase involved in cell wall biosynthesis